MEKIDPFNIIGIAVRTENNDQRAIKDIGGLWGKFMSENIMAQIPNRIDNDIYCIYHEYEGDYTKPYTAFLGCKVENLDNIPDGFIGKSFNGGQYKKFVAKGNIFEGALANAWHNIWSSDTPRAYTYDFELYGKKAENPADAEVDIFIAVK